MKGCSLIVLLWLSATLMGCAGTKDPHVDPLTEIKANLALSAS